MEKICQSCAMPMSPEFYGTKEDGSECDVYCTYCYDNGKFTQDMTMDQAIEHNLEYLAEWNETAGKNMTADEAREEMRKFFPSLRRWQ